MSAPRRLLEEGGTSLEMALLRSAKDDDPPPDALPRAMIAAGVGGAAISGGASLLAKPAGGLLKWAINLIVWAAAGLAGGAMFMGEAESPRDRRPIAADPAAAEVASEAGEDARAEALPEVAGEAAPEALAEVQSAISAPDGAPSPQKPAPQSSKTRAASAPEAKRPSLAEEVALLDSARRSLTAGDAEGALRTLEKHAKVFPGGALNAEAAVLRIEAFGAHGESERAISGARAFLSAFPSDPHVSHVKNLLHQHQGSEAGAQEGEDPSH